MHRYTYFSCSTSEALLMSDTERDTIAGIFDSIRRELQSPADGLYREQGLPTVKYCAQELCLSANYFSDLIRQITGRNATTAIRRHVMQRARTLLASGHTVSETASLLGYEHPQHFSRQFKSHFGHTPTSYSRQKNA